MFRGFDQILPFCMRVGGTTHRLPAWLNFGAFLLLIIANIVGLAWVWGTAKLVFSHFSFLNLAFFLLAGFLTILVEIIAYYVI